jgi:hypothetical protein
MEQYEERNSVRADLLTGKKPSRVFITPDFTLEAACTLAEIPLIQAHYSMELTEKAIEKVCETFYSDALPSYNMRYPPVYQMMGAKHFILGSGGAVQHPEIETMHIDEYDEFIAAPYKTILEKFLPRVCAALDTDPVSGSIVMAKAYSAYGQISGATFGISMKLSEKYGYAPGMITGGMTEAPFDFLAGQLRGFKSITMDIRRAPDKIEQAVEAIAPLMIKLGSVIMYPGVIDLIPLHLAPFINLKAFERLYWPTLEKVVVELDKKGVACNLFAEQDWTRYAEYLERLPKSSIIVAEAADPKRITETVGKNHIFSGFYDPTITLSKSKEECIDEAKRLLEICMKSDHFYFSFDKSVMDIKSINVSKLQSVLEWIRDNGKY